MAVYCVHDPQIEAYLVFLTLKFRICHTRWHSHRGARSLDHDEKYSHRIILSNIEYVLVHFKLAEPR